MASAPEASALPPSETAVSNSPVIPFKETAKTDAKQIAGASPAIVVPPPPAAEAVSKPSQISNLASGLDPCCTFPISVGFLALGIVMFLIFVTIAGVLGQSETIFCSGYWRLDLKYQFSGHSKVAVWALLQGATFFFLGLLCVIENLAASRKLITLRDQLRTLLLLTALFLVAWMIAGNVWIIGDENGGFGVVPIACKEGNMGNRNLYHFCLAILIFLDITVPLSLAAIIILTRNANDKSILNKTLGLSTVSPPNSMTVETAAVTNPEAKIDVSASACCTTTVSIGTFVFGLLMFVTFVTIAGVLGQSSTIFCNGYWNLDKKYQLSGHSTVAVWALLQGSSFFVVGLLWFLENRAAVMGAIALRDRLRTVLLLSLLFFLAWLIAGNIWILGDENNLGVVPDACKSGNMGNRNLYHFCLVIIIIMDITIPVALCVAAALTADFSSGTVLNRALCLSAATSPSQEAVAERVRKSNACCSLPVACSSMLLCVALFILFVTIPSVLEPGKMALPWFQTFCNGYWKADPKYQLSGHSIVAVWSLLQGATIFFLGLLWLLENRAAMMNAIALRDQLRTMILVTALFGIAWMIAGNVWIIGDEYGGSNLGVIPKDCKSGLMGNRNLYHFCLAMLIFLDIIVPLALLAVAVKTALGKTLVFCPIPPTPAPTPVLKPAPPVIVEEKLAPPPTTAVTMFIGQA